MKEQFNYPYICQCQIALLSLFLLLFSPYFFFSPLPFSFISFPLFSLFLHPFRPNMVPIYSCHSPLLLPSSADSRQISPLYFPELCDHFGSWGSPPGVSLRISARIHFGMAAHSPIGPQIPMATKRGYGDTSIGRGLKGGRDTRRPECGGNG